VSLEFGVWSLGFCPSAKAWLAEVLAACLVFARDFLKGAWLPIKKTQGFIAWLMKGRTLNSVVISVFIFALCDRSQPNLAVEKT
jgi:hypothetical protein